MATRTQTRSSNRSSNSSNNDRSAFSWSDNAGPMIGAALAGAAIGLAANYGRKALMQGMVKDEKTRSGTKGGLTRVSMGISAAE